VVVDTVLGGAASPFARRTAVATVTYTFFLSLRYVLAKVVSCFMLPQAAVAAALAQGVPVLVDNMPGTRLLLSLGLQLYKLLLTSIRSYATNILIYYFFFLCQAAAAAAVARGVPVLVETARGGALGGSGGAGGSGSGHDASISGAAGSISGPAGSTSGRARSISRARSVSGHASSISGPAGSISGAAGSISGAVGSISGPAGSISGADIPRASSDSVLQIARGTDTGGGAGGAGGENSEGAFGANPSGNTAGAFSNSTAGAFSGPFDVWVSLLPQLLPRPYLETLVDQVRKTKYYNFYIF